MRVRAIEMPLEIDTMAISSYGNASESSGVVRLLKDLNAPIEGNLVLIVEDMVDTGITLHYLLETLLPRHPASLLVCALLDKAKGRARAVTPEYGGFIVPDRFVVGYGIDFAEQYRNLPYVAALNRNAN